MSAWIETIANGLHMQKHFTCRTLMSAWIETMAV